MVDRDKVINGLEKIAEFFKARGDMAVGDGKMLLLSWMRAAEDALAMLKDSGQDEGWLCEKRTGGGQITDLLCACGNKVYFTKLLFKDGFTVNELYCPNCGLSMRSPQYDKEGVWLRKNWEEVVLRAQEPRVMTYEEVVEHYSLPPVFPDDLGMQEDYILDIEPLYFDFPNPTDWDVHWRGANQVNQYLERWAANYGKTWRVWTGCPTDEQRSGMPWDERERSSGQNED